MILYYRIKYDTYSATNKNLLFELEAKPPIQLKSKIKKNFEFEFSKTESINRTNKSIENSLTCIQFPGFTFNFSNDLFSTRTF